MLFHLEFSVVALIGIILLIGIVEKNAIMMIDFALEAERKEGKSPMEAIYQACLLRFRPILMTTMAAMLGGLPLALGSGIGSELRRPLGISIVGGLLVSQVLTLYTTPVVYIFFDKLASRITGSHASERSKYVARAVDSRLSDEHFDAIHSPARGDHAADGGHCAGGNYCVRDAAGGAAAADRFSHHQRAGKLAGRKPGDHGFVGCHAARAAVRPHRRHHGDDFVELSRNDAHHAAV